MPADLREQPGAVGPLPYIGYSTFVPSLRQSTDYRAKGPSISAMEQPDSSVDSGFNDPELRKRRRLMPNDAALISDDTVIQKWVDLDYAGYRRKQHQIHQLLKKVAYVASEITEGYSLEFLHIDEDDRGLFPEFRTPDGDLPLNVLSQGTQSTVQWLAHFLFGYAQYYDYPENLEEKPAILIVDEIDAHLHPSWQRADYPGVDRQLPQPANLLLHPLAADAGRAGRGPGAVAQPGTRRGRLPYPKTKRTSLAGRRTRFCGTFWTYGILRTRKLRQWLTA